MSDRVARITEAFDGTGLVHVSLASLSPLGSCPQDDLILEINVTAHRVRKRAEQEKLGFARGVLYDLKPAFSIVFEFSRTY